MEKIINLFPLFEGQILKCIGFRIHEKDGTDDEKINFLRSRVEVDSKEMAVTTLPDDFTIKHSEGAATPGISLDNYNILLHNGTDGILYEGIFQAFDFPENPLQISTPIVDGIIKFEKTMHFETKPKAPFTTKIEEELPKHYLDEFITEDGFDFVRLINEDFFGAIKLAYNNGFFVSTLKLLLSTIDTIAFLEYGDVSSKNIFKEWIRSYCDFSKLGVNDDELWEFRNSLLHMTNTQSRKVINQKVKAITFYVSKEDKDTILSDIQSKYFNLKSLIDVISNGIETWAESYNIAKEKFEGFLERYDMIISDSRYRKINM